MNKDVIEVLADYNSIIWLTRNRYAIVDNEDWDSLSQWKWHLVVAKHKSGTLFYARRAAYESGRQIIFLMHRIILKVPKGLFTDHINGNGLDNRRKNLRSCIPRQNLCNRNIGAMNTSGYKGVSAQRNKWCAEIYQNGKSRFLGSFKTAEQAARVYDDAALKLYGEFAKTNQMMGTYDKQ